MAVTSRPLDTSWLFRLRTASVAGIAGFVVLAHTTLGFSLPLGTLGTLLALWMGTNVLAWWRRGEAGARLSDEATALLLATDAVFLTAVFHQTGGPSNPFNFFYLVHLAIASMVLPARYVWALVGLSVSLFGLLFLHSEPLVLRATTEHAGHGGHGGAGGHDMEAHLRGMWVAFAIAASFIVWFVSGLARQLEERERALAEATAQAHRSERLASLATLAAGAAHELSTPLSTIAVVAGELRRDLEAGQTADAPDDVALIQTQVDRCREVLAALRTDAGDPGGEAAVPVPAARLVADSLQPLAARDRVVMGDIPDGVAVRAFPRGIVRALRGLVKNALEASTDAVQVRVTTDGHDVRFEVEDHGEGIATDHAARVGEPFFTTKPAGQGMGLGVFLARALAERLGGSVVHHSESGRGTVAVLSLPRATEVP